MTTHELEGPATHPTALRLLQANAFGVNMWFICFTGFTKSVVAFSSFLVVAAVAIVYAR